MTDITLSASGGFHIVNGVCPLISRKSDLIKQQLEITLNTFTTTWFDNMEFGVPIELMFSKNTKARLDAAYKRIIADVDGVISIDEYTSVLNNSTRVLTIKFKCSVEDGSILSETISVEV